MGVYPWKFTASVGGVTCEKTGRVMVSSSAPVGVGLEPRLPDRGRRAHGRRAGHQLGLRRGPAQPGHDERLANLYFLKKGPTTAAPSGVPVTVPAGRSVKLADVVENTFGQSASSGAVLIGSDRELLVTSRTYNNAASGTYGQYIEGYPVAPGGRGRSEEVRLIQLTQNANYRTNIGFANATGASSTVQVDLYRGRRPACSAPAP